jgi:hypothetical protein
MTKKEIELIRSRYHGWDPVEEDVLTLIDEIKDLQTSFTSMMEGKLPLAWKKCPGCPRLADEQMTIAKTLDDYNKLLEEYNQLERDYDRLPEDYRNNEYL